MAAKFGEATVIDGGDDCVLPDALLRARSPAEAVEAWFDANPALWAHGACVLWSTHWPRDIVAWPAALADAKIVADAIDAVSRSRTGMKSPKVRPLTQIGRLLVNPAWRSKSCNREDSDDTVQGANRRIVAQSPVRDFPQGDRRR